jgi:hypothetical protein
MSQFIRHVITGLGMVCLYHPSNAQQKPAYVPPRQYNSYQAEAPIKIDGIADENAWSKAIWSDDFTDIEGDKQPPPVMRTRLKMLWDQQYLYILAELEDPHIWATLHQHDTIIFQDNDFEVFVDPDGDGEKYFEIEINAHNTVMDLFMSKAYRVGGDALMTWDTKGIKTAVQIDGTLNNPRDKDKKWTVEMAVPFSAFAFFNEGLTPKHGTRWRINFSRVEWDTDIVNGQYIKRKDPKTGRSLPEHNWVWSPQGIINMHAPEKWGYLTFVSKPAGSAVVSTGLPAIEAAKEYLWDVWSRQQRYHRKHGKYANTLATLGITTTTVKVPNATYTLQMEAITDQFNATLLNNNSKERCTINQEGKIFQNSSNE